jgi:hypothetical protein
MGADSEGTPTTADGQPPNRPRDQDPVAQGVVMGQRVVDEWIRQAEQTARLLGGPSLGSGWPDASGRMFRAASDLMAAWISAFGLPMQAGAMGWRPGAPPGATTAPGANHRAAAAPTPSTTGEAASQQDTATSGRRVRLEVIGRRPVDVTIDVHRRSVTRFRVLDLRPETGDAPRITKPRLQAFDDDGLHLQLTVPDNQPAGTYHAVILDERSESAVGTLTIRIPE